jgi:alpha-L-rhamnosidase
VGFIERVWFEQRPVGPTLGIGDAAPRVSWLIAEGVRQVEYELETLDDNGEVVLSGRVRSELSRLADWPGMPMKSRERRQLRVHAWTSNGRNEWSEPIVVEAGLLERGDWVADFVSPSLSVPDSSATARTAYRLRAEFTVSAPFTKARIYSTAHGVYSLEVNSTGLDIGDLAPGWTSYRHELRYQTSDVTSLLEQGENAVGVLLADGWYRGRLGFNGGLWNNYGDDLSVLLQLELTSPEGDVSVIPLEPSWTWTTAPIVATGLYEGETFDARQEIAGWSAAGFDDSSWQSATRLPLAGFPASLNAPDGPPINTTERLPAVTVDHLANGRIRLDFGQNMAGKVEITVDAPAGHVVSIHHDGELAIRPLRTAAALDTFVGAGIGRVTWTPRFTLHGFRYVELEGWPGAFEPGDAVALVVHSDMERTGWFESSNPLLNRLHENVVWSMRSNFVDIPTDCPQRDERLGWTGDIQVFAPTASFIYSVYGTLQGWLRDLASEQTQFGSVPNFVPWIECGFPSDPAAAWGDAAVIVPWVLYERYGDDAILRQQYESMKAWVEQMATLAGKRELWDQGFQLGDWLDPAAPPDNPAASNTDKYIVATAYRIKSTRIMAQTARLLGAIDDASHFERMAERTLTAFRREYVTPSGRLASDTPTAYSLALVFDLLEKKQRVTAGKRLAELVEASNFHITTGFVGTPIVCDALAVTGSIDAAYHLLMQEGLPSWLYPVTMGATTIWERWDSLLPDGTVNSGEMTSFNHYALGAVADFMHRVVAGLAPAAPGYSKLRIAPQPGAGLRSASASHMTPYGHASSSWTRTGTSFELRVTVPNGCTAAVILPGGANETRIAAGSHVFKSEFRSPEDDPAIPEPFNIHNPEHRAARALAL